MSPNVLAVHLCAARLLYLLTRWFTALVHIRHADAVCKIDSFIFFLQENTLRRSSHAVCFLSGEIAVVACVLKKKQVARRRCCRFGLGDFHFENISMLSSVACLCSSGSGFDCCICHLCRSQCRLRLASLAARKERSVQQKKNRKNIEPHDTEREKMLIYLLFAYAIL